MALSFSDFVVASEFRCSLGRCSLHAHDEAKTASIRKKKVSQFTEHTDEKGKKNGHLQIIELFVLSRCYVEVKRTTGDLCEMLQFRL